MAVRVVETLLHSEQYISRGRVYVNRRADLCFINRLRLGHIIILLDSTECA